MELQREGCESSPLNQKTWPDLTSWPKRICYESVARYQGAFLQ